MSLKRAACDSWTLTKEYPAECRHRWTIGDFFGKLISSKGFCLTSSRFGVDAGPAGWHHFVMKLFPNGDDDNDSVTLALYSLKEEEFGAEFQFYLETSDETPSHSFTGKTNFAKDRPVGKKKFLSHAVLKEQADRLLPNGTLSIVCHIKISYTRSTSGEKRAKLDQQQQEEPQSLGGQLKELLASSDFSDVTLVSGRRSFACHKLILSARSDVFSAMFHHKDTAEARCNKVVITDVKAEVLEQMLQFMYSDKCDLTTDNATDLLIAANKYNISGLKRLCEDLVGSNVDLENFDKILVLSYLHEAQRLKGKTMAFVLAHTEVVMESKRLKDLSMAHPEILLDLFLAQNKIKN